MVVTQGAEKRVKQNNKVNALNINKHKALILVK